MDILDLAKEVHNNKYDYSKSHYAGMDTPICIICPVHGVFWQTPYIHICGSGCPYCGESNRLKQSANEFKIKSNLVHNNIYDYSKVKYINAETPVCIICPKHGDFWIKPYTHLSGKGCPYCKDKCVSTKDSKISQKVENKLKELNISFIKEQTFDWLKYKSNMFIDFYLPDYNVAIECHGVQHFKPVDFFGGVEGYNERKCRDILKYKLCSDHNIKIYYFTDIYSEYFDKLYYDENILIEDICKLKKEEG